MAKKETNEQLAPKQARDGLSDDADYRLPYVDPGDHYVAQARGLDPAGIVGREGSGKSPDKPKPPY
jgi:hypothetical protein